MPVRNFAVTFKTEQYETPQLHINFILWLLLVLVSVLHTSWHRNYCSELHTQKPCIMQFWGQWKYFQRYFGYEWFPPHTMALESKYESDAALLYLWPPLIHSYLIGNQEILDPERKSETTKCYSLPGQQCLKVTTHFWWLLSYPLDHCYHQHTLPAFTCYLLPSTSTHGCWLCSPALQNNYNPSFLR